MEPGLSRGDLVLVRPDARPEVGDVVLYRAPELAVSVLHRVVAVERGRLVTRGDANDFLDDARPRPQEVVGELWVSVPRVGSALLWARVPLHAALVVFVLAIVPLAGGGAARSSGHAEASRG
jgi:signal peptidase I